jgi:hypothetical protein
VKVKTATSPAEAQLVVGNQTRDVRISENSWSEIKLDAIALEQGTNRLVWRVKSGTVDLDWLDLSPDESGRQSASNGSPALSKQ